MDSEAGDSSPHGEPFHQATIGEVAPSCYDAVHLASALALGADTTLVTWDRELRRATTQSGCAIAPAR